MKNNNKYKAIGFDYYGVIKGGSASNFNRRISEITGVSLEEFKVAYHHHNHAFNTGEITVAQLWEKVLLDLGKMAYLKKVLDVVSEPIGLNLEVINLIKELKAKGYKLGLLSNATRETARNIREVEHLDKLFELILVSTETGLAKPDKEAYLDFMKRLEVKAEELIFVDDARLNLEVAEELGITTIWCDDPSNLRNQPLFSRML